MAEVKIVEAGATVAVEIRVAAEAAEEPDECIMCSKNMEGRELVWLPCLHKFHGHCIRKWLKSHRTCPLCREIAIEGAGGREERRRREARREERRRERDMVEDLEERQRESNRCNIM